MKANEVRVGNWIHNFGMTNKITSEDIKMLEQGISTVEPIKLTDEWLITLGFEKLTDKNEGWKGTCYSHSKFAFIVNFDYERLSVDFWQGNEKRYVHELQNMFYVLSGQELEIKVN